MEMIRPSRLEQHHSLLKPDSLDQERTIESLWNDVRLSEGTGYFRIGGVIYVSQMLCDR